MRRSRTESRSTSTSARLAIVLVAAAALAGGVAYRATGDDGVRRLAWRDVSGELAGIEGPWAVFRVIRHASALDELQRELQPGTTPRRVRVDYGRRELVFVSAGPRSSTGYGVHVVSVEERRRSTLVTVRETTPSLGDPVEPRVTYPYALISIPRVDTHVRIRWQGQ